MGTTYKDAGVDIEAGDELVNWLVKSGSKSKKTTGPHQDKVISGIGGFAALFKAPFKKFKSPCLVSSTDGVGTKVKIASDLNDYTTVGQDLVAMCVNDLVCVGAQPLFFLDYYATGKLQLNHAKEFLSGVRKACHDSDCALIGGETAEMPGVYAPNDFDCAGFAVGIVEQSETLGKHRVKNGDRIIGIQSSGFHSNGYSLLRRLFANDMDRWARKLLVPTHLYARLILGLKKKLKTQLHGVAHVTGGGMDNLLRVVPDHLGVELKPWAVPQDFLEVQRRSQLPWDQMLITLNCGIGMAVMISEKSFDSAQKFIEAHGFKTYDLGVVTKNLKQQWRVDFKPFGKV